VLKTPLTDLQLATGFIVWIMDVVRSSNLLVNVTNEASIIEMLIPISERTESLFGVSNDVKNVTPPVATRAACVDIVLSSFFPKT
jgi:hypothetical protein